MLLKHWILPVLLVAASNVALGQPPANPAPAPQEELLLRMTGNWTADEVHHPGGHGPGGSGKGTLVGKMGPGRKSLLLDYVTSSGPFAGFKMHQVITWDPATSRYQAFWVTGFRPGVGSHEGERAGDSIVFKSERQSGGTVTKSKSEYTDITEDSFQAISSVQAPDGEWKATLTITYTKAEPRKKRRR